MVVWVIQMPGIPLWWYELAPLGEQNRNCKRFVVPVIENPKQLKPNNKEEKRK
jgi:hypothetical protein